MRLSFGFLVITAVFTAMPPLLSCSSTPAPDGDPCDPNTPLTITLNQITYDPMDPPNPIHVGDTVTFKWNSTLHDVRGGTHAARTMPAGYDCTADTSASAWGTDPGPGGLAEPQTWNAGHVWCHKFTKVGDYPYFCTPHCNVAMFGIIRVR